MKHGTKASYNQRKVIQQSGLDPHDWLVVKDQPGKMVLVHRYSDKTTKEITKE